MRELGISIYPNASNLEKNKEYIKLASKYGFTRIFTCLLSIDKDREKIIENFKETILYANSLGFKVIADVNPKLFSELNISYDNLEFFNNLNVFGIRLDEGFSGNEEALMSFNKYNIKIELNMSNCSNYLDNIVSYKPDLHNILGCHNFYPHKYTGLDREFFRKCNQNFKKYGIRTSAFVNSLSASNGPWKISEGLCTLEQHRNLPIEIQAKDLFKEGIDCVIIGNSYASELELKKLSELNKNILELQIEVKIPLSEVEEQILFETLHFNRGDINSSLIRSTQSRVKFKGHIFNPTNTVDIEVGDIIIDNSLYGQYSGELQIAKKNIKNEGKSNIVAHIIPEELYLIEHIEPWEKFILKKFNR